MALGLVVGVVVISREVIILVALKVIIRVIIVIRVLKPTVVLLGRQRRIGWQCVLRWRLGPPPGASASRRPLWRRDW